MVQLLNNIRIVKVLPLVLRKGRAIQLYEFLVMQGNTGRHRVFC